MTTQTRPSVTAWMRTIVARAVMAGVLSLVTAGVTLAQPAAPGGATPAAQAAPSLDALLAQVASFDGGKESDALWRLRDYVRAHRDDAAGRQQCETAMVPFLTGKATPSAKTAVAEHLRRLAGDSAVPALRRMLDKEAQVDLALYVLQPLPGAVADRALLDAVATAPGRAKAAVIGALGRRRLTAAVPVLSPLMAQPAFAAPAAIALGRIGGADAVTALTAALGPASGEQRGIVASALLQAADAAAAAGQIADARAIYEGLRKAAPDTLTASARRAVAAGLIATAGPDASRAVLAMLAGTDEGEREAAAMRIKAVFPASAIGDVCRVLPTLPDGARIQVLGALATYPAAQVSETIVGQIMTGSDPVKLAALKAYGVVGGEKAAAFLVGLGAETKGPVQAAARAALGQVPGRGVDPDLEGMLAGSPTDGVAAEVLAGLGERRVFSARPAIVRQLTSPSRAVRVQALRALRAIGSPADLAAILDLMVANDDDAERNEGRLTVAALAARANKPTVLARPLRAALMGPAGPATAAGRTVPPETRAVTLSLLPLIGDDTSLPLLRMSITHPDPIVVDAAVRAIADWPTAAVRDDLWALAKDAGDETHRLLALRGVIRLLGAEVGRQPDAAVSDLKRAFDLATRAEERRLVLGALPTFASKAALDLASSLVQDQEVGTEAKAAVASIQDRTRSPFVP